MELDVHPELTIEAVNLYKPDLIIAPFLKRKIGVGDWVLVHVGFAIQKLDPDYALESLRLFEELLEEGKREGMVGKEEKDDSSERQWEGSGV